MGCRLAWGSVLGHEIAGRMMPSTAMAAAREKVGIETIRSAKDTRTRMIFQERFGVDSHSNRPPSGGQSPGRAETVDISESELARKVIAKGRERLLAQPESDA